MGQLAYSIGVGVLAAATFCAEEAAAQVDLVSAERFHASVDIRAVVADAERSWLEGGFGKTRFGRGDASLKPSLAEVLLVWTPQLSEQLRGVVSLEIQDGQDQFVDVGEAYLTWRAPSGFPLRITSRAGLYYPDISLEHDGPEWAIADTLTPSAINTWVAEELKVLGLEATTRLRILGAETALTAGVFSHDDKAGTLLAFRGWALHDLKATANMELPLSPIGDFGRRRAEPVTTTVLEIDDRLGLYGRLEWQAASDLTFSLFAYDNAGDRLSRVRQERAWDTTFTAAGVTWTVNDRTRVRAQLLKGDTAVGGGAPGAFRVLVDYASGYASVTQDIGPGALTSRIDLFEVEDRVSVGADNNDETGWAATLAYRWDIRPGADVTLEALRVSSERPSRARIAESPEQQDIQFQTSFRQRF